MRKSIIAVAAALVALSAAHAPTVFAADYPAKAVHLDIGSAPGGSTDTLGRMLAKSLEQNLGQSVVVQNKTGAGGGVMATQLMNTAPDGYTIGMNISNAYSGNPVLNASTTKYTYADFTHLASVSKGQCALVTRTENPYKTFNDLVDAAKRGEQPAYASQSPLTKALADYVAKVAGVKFRIISVQGGGGVMQAVLGGHADFGFSGGPHVEQVAAGKMRVLASAEDERLATSPDVPTLKELGYDISSCSFFIVSAPKGLPADVKAKLSSALEKSIKSEDMQNLIKNLKYPPYYNGPDAVDRIIKAETESLARAIARINE